MLIVSNKMSQDHAEASHQTPESTISTIDKEEHCVDIANHPEEEEEEEGLQKAMRSITRLHSEKDNGSGQKPLDPNIVDWDGPDDPANPMNWSKFKGLGHVAFISIFTLVVLVSTIYVATGPTNGLSVETLQRRQ